MISRRDDVQLPPDARDLVRVLVVEDSVTQRARLVALLESEADIEVVGFATMGAEAVRSAIALKPDLITMDLRLPDFDGLEATRRIMQVAPTPIVVVTAHAASPDREAVAAALDAGALALVAKPGLGPGHEAEVQELLRVVRSMARIRVVRRRPVERQRALTRSAVYPPEIVVLGASTGGPEVLRTIFSALPATFPLPILVVQHMAAGFTGGMVDWLRPLCALPIQLATSGTALPSRGIFVAPSSRHLVVRGRTMTLTDDAPVRGHRPSATLLFRSVAEHYGPRAVGVLLTGMGDDGAVGLRDLKDVGAVTVAQDKASSVIFGMPGSAIELGAVDYVLPPTQIGELLTRLAASPGGA